MSISDMISWAKENYITILDWLISIAAIVVPLIISRPGKYKIADKKNFFKGYITFTIKAAFYQFALLCIFGGVGGILRIPNSIDWLSKKPYLICCAVISGLCCLAAGLKWASELDITKRGGRYGRLCTVILIVLPILLQTGLHIFAAAKTAPSRHWIFIWIPLNLVVILVAVFTVSDHDFFAYRDVILTLGDSESYEIEPDALYSKGKWIIVDSNVDGKTAKFPEEHVQKVECYWGDWKKSNRAMSFGIKVGYCVVCLYYLLIIGLASQLFFQAANKPIIIAESQIHLEQNEHYQLNAVATDPDAEKLSYTVSGSPAISVSENGVVMVDGALLEDDTATAKIRISDDVGNTATVQVEVIK